MFCSYCGNKLLEEAKFCHVCGRILNIQEDNQLLKKQENNNLLKDNNIKNSEETEDKILAVFFILACMGAMIYLIFS